MKKNLFTLFTIAIITLTSCEKNNIKEDSISGTCWVSSHMNKTLTFDFIDESNFNIYYTNNSGAIDGRVFRRTYNYAINSIDFKESGWSEDFTSYKLEKGSVSGNIIKVKYRWSTFGGSWHYDYELEFIKK